MSNARRRSLPAGVVFVLLVLAQCALPQTTQGYQLPDTCQTKCYDGAQEIPCPQPGEDFYGQDAQYQGPQPAYRDNGDGTVTDLNTGLMWQQGDDQNDYIRTWRQALDYCTGLDLASHSDWRLPTRWRLPSRRELISLVDYSIPDPGPTIDTRYFPGCRSDYYWSSSTYATYSSIAWLVHFGDGDVYTQHKSSYNYSVRCVRSGP